jgi:hypothetical protein
MSMINISVPNAQFDNEVCNDDDQLIMVTDKLVKSYWRIR